MLIVWTHTSLSTTELSMWMQRIYFPQKPTRIKPISRKNIQDANIYPAKTDKTQKPTGFELYTRTCLVLHKKKLQQNEISKVTQNIVFESPDSLMTVEYQAALLE